MTQRSSGLLRRSTVVDVRGMSEEVCEHLIFVNVAWQGRLLAVPLIQLTLYECMANQSPSPMPAGSTQKALNHPDMPRTGTAEKGRRPISKSSG
jgi:hypothetical protein